MPNAADSEDDELEIRSSNSRVNDAEEEEDARFEEVGVDFDFAADKGLESLVDANDDDDEVDDLEVMVARRPWFSFIKAAFCFSRRRTNFSKSPI